jgi:hypothetical protein
MYEGAIDFALGQFGDGGELARLQHPLPAEGAGQRLDQRVVGSAQTRSGSVPGKAWP